MSQIISTPVEITRRAPSGAQGIAVLFINLVVSPALGVTLAWWFFATWFPQLGISWWALVLPWFALRSWIGPNLKVDTTRLINKHGHVTD